MQGPLLCIWLAHYAVTNTITHHVKALWSWGGIHEINSVKYPRWLRHLSSNAWKIFEGAIAKSCKFLSLIDLFSYSFESVNTWTGIVFWNTRKTTTACRHQTIDSIMWPLELVRTTRWQHQADLRTIISKVYDAKKRRKANDYSI